ncbi:MAG: hypothetical protein K2O35_04670, partial [Clostridia bacterium]|nr:hypothetical protein [Clostridia bacterium]
CKADALPAELNFHKLLIYNIKKKYVCKEIFINFLLIIPIIFKDLTTWLACAQIYNKSIDKY